MVWIGNKVFFKVFRWFRCIFIVKSYWFGICYILMFKNRFFLGKLIGIKDRKWEVFDFVVFI